MYKPRKNFLSYEVPSAEAKKADAKKILSSIFEALSVEELNALYQPTDSKITRPMEPVQMSAAAPADQLLPVSDTLITVGKLPMEDDQIVVDVKKPVKVVFRDSSNTSNTTDSTAPMAEDNDAYDFLESAPPMDLSSDLTDTVISRGQGMMGSVKITPGGLSVKPDAVRSDGIKPVEEDIEGFSVVGLDNTIGMDMLK